MEANVGKSAVITVIVLTIMCPACYKGCKCQGTAPRCTSAVYMETSHEKEIWNLTP